MPTMTKMQIKRVEDRLKSMLRDKVAKMEAAEEKNTLKTPSFKTRSAFAQAIIEGTIILKPDADIEHFYGELGVQDFVNAKDFVKYQPSNFTAICIFQEAAKKEIEKIIDGLVFLGATNAPSIFSSFETFLSRK